MGFSVVHNADSLHNVRFDNVLGKDDGQVLLQGVLGIHQGLQAGNAIASLDMHRKMDQPPGHTGQQGDTIVINRARDDDWSISELVAPRFLECRVGAFGITVADTAHTRIDSDPAQHLLPLGMQNGLNDALPECRLISTVLFFAVVDGAPPVLPCGGAWVTGESVLLCDLNRCLAKLSWPQFLEIVHHIIVP